MEGENYMALLQFENVAVHYEEQTIVTDINLTIEAGSFTTIFGASGSGKSTLLKQLKVASHSGRRIGNIYFEGELLENWHDEKKLTNIATIHQNPEEQIITEDVWHELAFGLENIGLSTQEMKLRIGEVAHFLGIQKWFREKTHTLSGGQKQLLNIASALVLHPKLLVLDEPTAQLDPIAAKELIELLGRMNRDLGVTILLVEHHLEAVLPHASHFVYMDNGRIQLQGDKKYFFQQFVQLAPNWQPFLPASIQLSLALYPEQEPAWTIQQAVNLLRDKKLSPLLKKKDTTERLPLVSIENLSYKYERLSEVILRNVSLTIYTGEILTLIGGNGAGKSTLLQLISGQRKAFRGKIYYKEQRLRYNKTFYQQNLAFLPQNPLLLFLENTVRKDYEVFCKRHGLSKKEAENRIARSSECLKLHKYLDQHPEDLSGGQRQKVAIGKLLLYNPEILLLDEPTKGLDPVAKAELKAVLKKLQQQGTTLLIVTHDLEFAAAISTRCGLLFDGEVVAVTPPEDFFKAHHFYTTAAKLITKDASDSIILTNELIASIPKGEVNNV